jgi:hypothetical protein
VPKTTLFSCAILLIAAVSLSPKSAHGQQPDTRAPEVIEAGRLRDSGKFSEAVLLLRQHRTEYPNDGDAIRMLAETLYWMKDFAAARALYDSAIVLHPEDVLLRQQYDSFITATADNTTKNSTGETANDRSTAPWVALRLGGTHDDQPLDRWGGEVEGGYYLTPVVSMKARAGSEFFSVSCKTDESGTAATLRTVHGSLGIAGYSLATHTDFSVEGGFIQRDEPSHADWTGMASIGLRLHPYVRLGASAGRSAYLYTAASLRTTVMTDNYSGTVDIDGKGWLGRAVYSIQEFPDDNSGTSAYAWGMAPLVNTSGAVLQAGYSISYQDTRELRFVLTPQTDYVGESVVAGHYAPYYTPQNILSHSIIAAFTGNSADGFVVRVGGSFGVHATEDAPGFMAGPGESPLVKTIASRSFHPWNARASVEKTLSQLATIDVKVEQSKTAFYNATTGGVGITWHLAR